MKLKFTKMHGAGNDFVVLDGIHQQIDLTPAQWRALASRHFGVGADQILIVEKPTRPDVDFRYRIVNADGSEVEHCGNGARCFVRFVTEQGMTDKRSVRVEVMNGVITLTLQDDGQVTVDMGAPELEPVRVPFRAQGLPTQAEGADTLYGLEVNGRTEWISAVSMGNPHAVQVVDDVENFPVLQDGPVIEHHPAFPNRVNAGFMQVKDRHAIRLRVYERGAGETLACGTGACAAVVAGIRRGLLDSPVRVQTHGGELTIAWDGGAGPVRMTGPATTVFEGSIDLAALPA
ncbi:diaminopimelate epimerase [Cupriavidus taiwanensis]|uniref:Diaminopimelate epimerase n=1 Tax=Cupriavidus taiwanensis TaxID=164546 RepID=A0A375BPQ6_9BURK|nr:diaminopimelate epimerase [Cupriavidus taiwanensis]MDK3023315.1 diaminopimelate epimerase [Cupriavidus taiwanensis]NSX14886.1 diaminopimelate epimerase [Cupriavidus taiwanensis]SOY49926.1 diaminopimelate epimerase [Cupriavidus taiwanensis]